MGTFQNRFIICMV